MPSSTPTTDPLAIPVLPEHPTQIELGKHVYYYNCMPCHGDHGQGLTDEWRQVWEEDHRNCWARGCHGGRAKDEGFPLATTVPAVMLDSDALQGYAQQDDLFEYLRTTHPPQDPGRLTDDDYRVLVTFLWSANQKETEQTTAKPTTSLGEEGCTAVMAAGGVFLFLLGLLLAPKIVHRCSKPRNSP